MIEDAHANGQRDFGENYVCFIILCGVAISSKYFQTVNPLAPWDAFSRPETAKIPSPKAWVPAP